MTTLIVLTVAALITATISGILGMGGGITLLGVMAIVLDAPLVVPLHGVVQLGSNGTRTVAFLKHVRWRLVAAFAPALAIGVTASSLIYDGERLSWLKPVIGGYLLFFLVWRRKSPALRSPPLFVYSLLGLVAGFAALYIGATGPMLAPFFLRDDLDKEEVIGTKAACQILVHISKLPAFFALGFAYEDHLPLLGALLAAVVGTLLGKRILGAMKSETFILLFEIVLGCLGVWLIVQPLVVG